MTLVVPLRPIFCRSLTLTRPGSIAASISSFTRNRPHIYDSSQKRSRTINARQQSTSAPNMSSATNFYDFTPKDSTGNDFPLEQLRGKVVLVVNTASKCGFTPQLDGLQALYSDVKAAHPNEFEVIGFPCNQFGGQDPGSNEEIQNFCVLNYKTNFKVLGKTEVNGDKAEPLYKWMKSSKPGLLGLQMIKWNFEKFLIGRDGQVKGRWASTTKPESLKKEIEKELAASAPATKTEAAATPTTT